MPVATKYRNNALNLSEINSVLACLTSLSWGHSRIPARPVYIVTTEANELMSEIHNNKKRIPSAKTTGSSVLVKWHRSF